MITYTCNKAMLRTLLVIQLLNNFFYDIGPSGNSGKTISIIHCSDLEGKAFQEKVFDLYDQFSRTLGYKCHLDKLEIVKVAENKFRYAVKSVQQSDFVFICISPELKRIFDSSLEEISDSLEGWFTSNKNYHS